MNHITTRKHADGIDVLYHKDGADINTMTGLDRVSRSVIGLTFPETGADYGYACVAVERTWWPYDGESGNPARQYVIIDEVSRQTPRELLDAVVVLKDRYLSETIACPNEPHYAVEGLRRHDGINHYPDLEAIFLRERFPTYVSRDTTAYIRETPIPDGASLARDMDQWWGEDLIHPSSGVELFTPASDRPLKKLVVLGAPPDANFSTREASQGVQTGDSVIRTAIWLAVKCLEESIWIHNSRNQGKVGRGHTWKPARSGY